MPKAYEKIRDKFVSQGVPLKEAKTKAAKIYNAMRGDNKKLPKLSNKHKKK